MKILVVLLSSIAMMSASKCSEKKPVTTDHSPLVKLEMYGCRGFCPSYNLLFHNDGIMAYEGLRNVVKMGVDSTQLTGPDLKRLQEAVEAINLWQYPKRIESQIADAPNSLLAVYNGEKRHEVRGSVDRPKPILEFETMLKDLAEKYGFKVKEGVNPYEAPPNQQEILVKFEAAVNPGNFMMQFQEIRLRIVRRVSAENLWIIGYNPDQITEKQLIDMMKVMDGVLEAKPNKQK